MTESSISLTKQQVIWLKDLVRADIKDWQNMAARPVDEIGIQFAHLASVRIENMQTILARLDAIEAAETLRNVCHPRLNPDVFRKNCGSLVVVLGD